MNRVPRPSVRARRLAIPFLLAALLLGSWAWYHTPEQPPAARPDLEHWDVPRLAEYLRSRGLTFRLVPIDQGGTNVADNAYLTTTGETWEELDGLPKIRERIDDWAGTVYCERVNQPGRRDLQIKDWGDCALKVGPFIFFGDRGLLARLRNALRPPGS